MATELTPQQKIRYSKFIEGIAKGLTGVEAARQAGYKGDNRTLAMTASRLIRNDNIQEASQGVLAKHGVTVENAANIVGKAMKARKHIKVTYTDDDGTVKSHYVDVDNLDMQLKGVDRAFKLLGVGEKGGSGGDTYNFHLHQAEQRQKYDLEA